MQLPEISIRRPVFAWMLMFGLIVFGAISFSRMGISNMPDVNFPVVNIALTLENAAAIRRLMADPGRNALFHTTCVATMLTAGHAPNALPQRATANINCRIFPGHKPADIMAELQRVGAEPKATFTDVTEGSVATDPSPMRADLIKAINKAMKVAWPGVPVFPSQASGASDSMWFRANGVASYGASPVFIKDSDDFSHGLNERIHLSNIRPGIAYYISLFGDLSK